MSDADAAFAPIPQIGLTLTEADEAVITTEARAFIDSRLAPLVPSSARRISLDGLDGTGKTTIGRALALTMGATFVDLDDFLRRQQGRFLDSLRLNDLRTCLDRADLVIVAGCLMNATLQRIGHVSDYKVYLVRTTRMRSQPELEWVDERELLCGDEPAETMIAQQEENARRWAEAPPPYGGGDPTVPELQKELIRYHRNYAPHKNADLIIRLARLN